MISETEANACGWGRPHDGYAEPPASAMPQVEVVVGHRSGIAGARWCRPIGWSPRNSVEGADWSDEDGAWLTEEGEAAGIDKSKLAQQVADAFLAQILKTSYSTATRTRVTHLLASCNETLAPCYAACHVVPT